jgi:hypothetical protein
MLSVKTSGDSFDALGQLFPLKANFDQARFAH